MNYAWINQTISNSDIYFILNEFVQMKQMMIKLQSSIEDSNLEGVSNPLSELEALQDLQEEYMVQLETEQMLLLNKIKELGQEILNSSPSRRSSGSWGKSLLQIKIIYSQEILIDKMVNIMLKLIIFTEHSNSLLCNMVA